MQTKTPVKWEEKTLGEICNIRPNKQEARNKLKDNELVSFVPMEYLGINQKYFESGIDKSVNEVVNSYTYFADNDVLLAKITPCFENGKLGIAQNLTNGIGFGSSEYIVFRPNEHLDSNFLYYFLNRESFRQEGAQNMHGAVGHKRVAKEFIENYKIKIPDIHEQQRIVEIIDKAFEDIDQITANAKQNVQNAKDLFESYINQIFICYTDWQEISLGKLTTKIGSGSTPKGGKDSYHKTGISLVRSMNVYDRAFEYAGLAFINDVQAKKLDGVTLHQKDVLINITGGSIARCCVVPDEYLPARVNQHVSIVRAIQEKVLPEFLCYLLTARTYKHKLLTRGEEGGSTRQALTKTDLENFKVCIPKTIKEQQQIIDRLDSYLTETKQLEQIYQQKIEQAEKLKQSILQKAFNGEL